MQRNLSLLHFQVKRFEVKLPLASLQSTSDELIYEICYDAGQHLVPMTQLRDRIRNALEEKTIESLAQEGKMSICVASSNRRLQHRRTANATTSTLSEGDCDLK